MSRTFKTQKPARERDPARLRRLAGTKGAHAAVGEALEVVNGQVSWELNPAYAAWFWPLMAKATGLTLSIPESELEPLERGDCVDPPRAPTEKEKDEILKFPDRPQDSIRVYTLVLKGKPALVHKAFPTRTVNVRALRFCREQVGNETK